VSAREAHPTELAWYVGGGLEGAEREAIRAHLEQCPACRREVARLRALKEGVTALMDHLPESPPDVWNELGARLGFSSPPVGPLFEVKLHVRDMDAMVRFYRDVFGFPVQYPRDLDAYGDRMWVTLDTGGCTLALHGGAPETHNPLPPVLTFRVADIEGARAALESQGVPLEPAYEAAPGVWVCEGRDPEGNRFALKQAA